jgi:hypothetical protein
MQSQIMNSVIDLLLQNYQKPILRKNMVAKKTPLSLGAVSRTARGFELLKFTDRYGVQCSLQASSLADHEKPGTSAVWLGPDNASPKVMASEAASVGVNTEEKTGFVPYPIPAKVSLTTRMHLDREQVSALIISLQTWLESDSFSPQAA